MVVMMMKMRMVVMMMMMMMRMRMMMIGQYILTDDKHIQRGSAIVPLPAF